ncbi:MAG: adenylate/guanylate cyclase domain-containing protein [Burkholderiales bacterium]|nr:adenylate/guanylate cyclase domain-containing protein [Burkholderiales bacterium]MDE2276055.1 adenylate/guanylate cyclase domain-containing protein [Burkholderiales bacterium]
MLDFSSLTMTEIIRLQNQLQQELTRRFERPLALAFSDIVGSTAYFARFGDAAGRQLQQLHFDLLAECIGPVGGRVVDTAGDGAFLVFPHAGAALDGAIALQAATARANESRGRQQQLVLRIGLHWGRVLSDGSAVSGDAVNLCARVAASALAGELRLTRALFQELQREHRLNCRSLGDTPLPGFAEPVELLTLDWRDPALFPRSLTVEETSERMNLPRQDIVAFGRLLEHNGVHANDIVLTHPDPTLQRQISRWHFELRRTEHGMHLVALSDSGTSVDGQPVGRGQTAPVRAGSRIRVAEVLTLRLLGAEGPVSDVDDNSTMMLGGPARGLPTHYD